MLINCDLLQKSLSCCKYFSVFTVKNDFIRTTVLLLSRHPFILHMASMNRGRSDYYSIRMYTFLEALVYDINNYDREPINIQYHGTTVYICIYVYTYIYRYICLFF